jgi:cyanophycinase
MVKKEVHGNLVAVGGGESSEITEDSIKIFEKFIELSGGIEKARIVLMTVATDEPEEAEKRYANLFERLKFKNYEAVNIADRSESFDEMILKKIERASGLYFTGGDQLHVTALTGGTPLHELIVEKFEKGLTIGGTSAGAMMMSSTILVSGLADSAPRLDAIEVAPGMNLLRNSIIDTHFSQRGRHGRLLSAVAHNPQVLGFGIDERTAMVIGNGKFEIIGEGAVTVIDAGNSKHTNLPYIKRSEAIGICGVNFHVLPEGFKYDLVKREPISQPMKKMMAAVNED